MSAPPWTPVDFGSQNPGVSNVSATGTTTATAYQITKKVTHFGTVGVGALAMLPSSFAAGVELRLMNRGANALTVVTDGVDQIENYGTSVAISAPGSATITSFDPPTVSPRYWWLTS